MSVARSPLLLSMVVWGLGCTVEKARDSGTVVRCGGDAAPQTIEEAVEVINALPAPVDGPCFVRSLARPLVVVASSSIVSAQPAVGEARPRLFIQSGPLMMTLVPAGTGANLLEFGERYVDDLTRKGELVLPVEAPLALDAPFTRVAHETYGSTCAVCHRRQDAHPDGGTVSEAIRPEGWYDVPLDELAHEAARCEGEGCALLEAVFEDEVVPGSFPEHWPTVRDLVR